MEGGVTSPAAPDPTLIGIFETEVSETVTTMRDQLLRIEQQLGKRAVYPGKSAFVRRRG